MAGSSAGIKAVGSELKADKTAMTAKIIPIACAFLKSSSRPFTATKNGLFSYLDAGFVEVCADVIPEVYIEDSVLVDDISHFVSGVRMHELVA